MSEVAIKAKVARKAALKLASVSSKVKNSALLKIASAIMKNREELLRENSEDLKAAKVLLAKGSISKAFFQRLKLSEDQLLNVANMVRSVAKLEDPVGKTISAIELHRGLDLYRVICPIGVTGAIFEARPDVLPQISALCLKSGNAVILKGGKEAKSSNEALFELIRKTSEKAGIPTGWMQLIEARREVRELLKLDDLIDLLVPRGSKDFVKYIQGNTNIPVLGHSDGLCHIYVDVDADIHKAVKVCHDAKVQYPSVCNAVETILVHKDIAPVFLGPLGERYMKAGVEVRGDERTRKILPWARRAKAKDWSTEYLDLVVSIKVVGGVQEAIDHVNTCGSKHTDSILTENKKTAIHFLSEVDSSTVMLNTSTRFSDGYRYGLGAEVGISTGKIHARGPVGLDGLTTSKFHLVGDGHVVADYVGKKAKLFSHRRLTATWGDFRKTVK